MLTASKVEAAINAGLKNVIVPKSNKEDIIIDKKELSKINLIPVENIQEVLEHVIDWKGHEDILKKIKKNLLSDWSIVKEWNPEQRYSRIEVTSNDAADMIDSSRKILGEIWKI